MIMSFDSVPVLLKHIQLMFQRCSRRECVNKMLYEEDADGDSNEKEKWEYKLHKEMVVSSIG